MRVWGRALVSAGLLALLFVILPWEDMREGFRRLSLSAWVTALGLFLLGHQLGVVKWRMLLRAGGARLSFVDATRCYAAGLFANLCLPSIVGGDVLRAGLAARATGRTEAALWGGVVDRVLDILTMLILVAVGVALVGRRLPDQWRILAPGLAVIATAAVISAAAIVSRRPLNRWPRRIRRRIGRSLVALRHLRRAPRSTAGALALSLVIQAGFVWLNYKIGTEVGVNAGLEVWFLVWPLAKIAGLVPVSLGGLAVRDATLGALLLPFGVPMSLGVVAALLWQTVLIAGGLLAGGLWWVLNHDRSRLPANTLWRIRATRHS